MSYTPSSMGLVSGLAILASLWFMKLGIRSIHQYLIQKSQWYQGQVDAWEDWKWDFQTAIGIILTEIGQGHMVCTMTTMEEQLQVQIKYLLGLGLILIIVIIGLLLTHPSKWCTPATIAMPAIGLALDLVIIILIMI